MEHFFECIPNIDNALTTKHAFSELVNAVSRYDYDRVCFCVLSDNNALKIPQTFGLLTTYPDDWVQYYSQQGYIESDPVVLRGRGTKTPFFWNDLKADRSFSKQSLDILDEGAEACI